MSMHAQPEVASHSDHDEDLDLPAAYVIEPDPHDGTPPRCAIHAVSRWRAACAACTQFHMHQYRAQAA